MSQVQLGGGQTNGSSPAEMQEELCRQAEALEALNIRFYEQHLDRVMEELVPLTARLVGDVIELVKRLQASSEVTYRGIPIRAKIDRALDDAVSSIETSSSVMHDRREARKLLGDTTFVIQMVLRPKSKSLAAAADPGDEDGLWNLIDRCSNALRNALKSLRALERLHCRATGLSPKLQYSSQLQVSINTRRRYADIWRHSSLDATSLGSLIALFRGFGTGLAILVGDDIYPDLRVNDRRQILSLQCRVLEWLRDPGKDEQSGRRIWQDVVGFLMVLRQVSRREELVKNDAELISELNTSFADEMTGISDEMYSKMRLLYGYSDPIDALVRSKSRDVHAWRKVIRSYTGLL